MPIELKAPLRRSDFRWLTSIAVDRAQANQRHVDNVALYSIFHSARAVLNLDIIARMSGEEHFSDQMIVRVATDFAAEVLFAPQLDVFARISGVGRTSYEIDLAIFVGEKLAVRCSTVNVWMDCQGPRLINETARKVLASLA